MIIGVIDDQGVISTKRAFLLSTVFSIGILVTIAVIGIITSACGRMLGDIGKYGNYFVAVIFFLVGLYLLGVVPAPWKSSKDFRVKGTGLWSCFIIGLIFGMALGPCTFAYMAPMLGIVFSVSATLRWSDFVLK